MVRVDSILARKKVLKVLLKEANDNVSLTARLCGISRPTVRKIYQRYLSEGVEGLKDRSRRPKNPAGQTAAEIESAALAIFERTNYDFRRIARALRRKGIKLSYGGVRKALKRHELVRPRKKITVRKTRRRYYNPLDFKPFEFLQVDTKEVIDGDTLPVEVYQHFRQLQKQRIPMYQFTALDVRNRFSASLPTVKKTTLLVMAGRFWSLLSCGYRRLGLLIV